MSIGVSYKVCKREFFIVLSLYTIDLSMLNWKTIRVGDIFVLDRAHIPLLALLKNIIMSLTGMPVYHFVLLSISFYYN
jgi:hypothetical protein